MTQKKLHPSVLKFKEFVKNNPKIIQEVRKGNATWQELYEDWYLLGEDDKRWELMGAGTETEKPETKKSTDSKGELMANFLNMVKKMDPNQVQNHLNNLSQALGAIQGLLSQFQGNNPNNNAAKPQAGPPHPFSFRKD